LSFFKGVFRGGKAVLLLEQFLKIRAAHWQPYKASHSAEAIPARSKITAIILLLQLTGLLTL